MKLFFLMALMSLIGFVTESAMAMDQAQQAPAQSIVTTELQCGAADSDQSNTNIALGIYSEGELHCADQTNGDHYSIRMKGITLGAGFATGDFFLSCKHPANASILGPYYGIKAEIVVFGGISFGKYWKKDSQCLVGGIESLANVSIGAPYMVIEQAK
jgi:hypothetical protein